MVFNKQGVTIMAMNADGAAGDALETADEALEAADDALSGLDGKQDVLVSGTTIKTVNGESLLGAGNLVVSATVAITEIELDFGSVPVTGKTFTVMDEAVLDTSKIMVTPSGNPATGRVGNDFAWDMIQFTPALAPEVDGQFDIDAAVMNGSVVGKRNIFYTVG